MSQHNIIGSEAFDRRPFVLIRSYRVNGLRRRRASTTLAYLIVAVVALLIGAVVVALAMGPQLVEAQARRAMGEGVPSVLTAPAVPGSSASANPSATPTAETSAPAGQTPQAATPQTPASQG